MEAWLGKITNRDARKTAVVIGLRILVGKPMLQLLLMNDAFTVTMAHFKTNSFSRKIGKKTADNFSSSKLVWTTLGTIKIFHQNQAAGSL